MPACLLRQLFGHYAIRALPAAATEGLTEASRGLQDVASALAGEVIPEVFFDETIADTHVRWVEHADLLLPLQGYLEITIRLADPGIDIDAVNAILQLDVGIVRIEDAQFRLRLQPYFHAIAPAQGVCDSCGRRRPDETIHWAVADARVIRDHHPRLDLPTDDPPAVDGCSLGCLDVADCYLRNCDSQQAAGFTVNESDDLVGAFEAQLSRALSTKALRALDRLFYGLTSDALTGGMVMGRLEAVDALRDAPVCQVAAPPAPPPPTGPAPPDPPPLPAILNPACTQGLIGHDRLSIADAIELLRVRDGLADVVGRDNQ